MTENLRLHWVGFAFVIAIEVLILRPVAAKAGEKESICPEYNDGDYWIFNARTVDFTVSRSNILDGDGFKVVYRNKHFHVEDYPYADNTLVTFFPCSGIIELVKLPLALDKVWSQNLSTTRDNLKYTARAKVIATSKFESGRQFYDVYTINRTVDFENGRVSQDFYYYYVPQIKSIVLYYRFANLPITSKIYLTARGSIQSQGPEPVNVNSLFDPTNDRRFLELYSKKPPGFSPK